MQSATFGHGCDPLPVDIRPAHTLAALGTQAGYTLDTPQHTAFDTPGSFQTAAGTAGSRPWYQIQAYTAQGSQRMPAVQPTADTLIAPAHNPAAQEDSLAEQVEKLPVAADTLAEAAGVEPLVCDLAQSRAGISLADVGVGAAVAMGLEAAPAFARDQAGVRSSDPPPPDRRYVPAKAPELKLLLRVRRGPPLYVPGCSPRVQPCVGEGSLETNRCWEYGPAAQAALRVVEAVLQEAQEVSHPGEEGEGLPRPVATAEALRVAGAVPSQPPRAAVKKPVANSGFL